MILESTDEQDFPPRAEEDRHAYGLRLQGMGFDEISIRKALRQHFKMRTDELSKFCEPFQQARLRAVAEFVALRSSKTDSVLTRSVARSLGIDLDQARHLVQEVRVRRA